MRASARGCVALALFAIVGATGVVPAVAQSFNTGFASLAGDSSKPIEIESDALEVRDQQGMAVFTGNVVVKRNDAVLRTSKLTVYYAGGAAGQATGASASKTEKPKGTAVASATPVATAAAGTQTAPGKPGAATAATPAGFTGKDIERLEADGKVLVTAQGEAATGDHGTVNLKTNILELTGDVTLSQGTNVVTGDKLVVNLQTGRARMESKSRVRVLLTPNGAAPAAPARK